MGTYYFEINPSVETYEAEAGTIIRLPGDVGYSTKISRLASYSDKVWYQSEDGEVNIYKDRMTGEKSFNVHHNEAIMKEFMWIKLKAKEYAGYA
jgi:hypothetical protein